MTIRTKLVLIFLLLAILPLTGIVLYNYVSSLSAFRQAVEAEMRPLAAELRERTLGVRDDLDSRVAALGQIDFRALLGEADASSGEEASRAYSDLMQQVGEVSQFVESFEFAPLSGGQDAEQPTLDEAPWETEVHPADSLVIYPSERLAEALDKLERQRGLVSDEYLDATIRQVLRQTAALHGKELEAMEAMRAESRELLGARFESPVRDRDGRLVGVVSARVRADQLLRRILGGAARDGGGVPYALDVQGNLHVASPEDRQRLEGVLLPTSGVERRAAESGVAVGDWMLVEAADTQLGLIFGIARPIGRPLRQIRQTAYRNFAGGLVIAVAALAGIAWVSGRITRSVRLLTAGAERLAEGDLEARVPVRSRDELGQLAATFNHMAQQLYEKQGLLLEEERLRREQAIQQRLLAAENERQTRELEEARQFQLALLPKELPRRPGLEVAVFMETATEVGGDYYDFLAADGGALVVAIGDATGHGARAGTMVSVVKGLFSVGAATSGPASFLDEATRAVRRMDLGNMRMSLTLVSIDGDQVVAAGAGMPPPLVLRARSGQVETIDLEGMPLGGLIQHPYRERHLRLEAGDTMLLMSDGFPELRNPQGEPLGYAGARDCFTAAAARPPQEVVGQLARSVRAWHGEGAPEDDITFVVVRREAVAAPGSPI